MLFNIMKLVLIKFLSIKRYNGRKLDNFKKTIRFRNSCIFLYFQDTKKILFSTIYINIFILIFITSNYEL